MGGAVRQLLVGILAVVVLVVIWFALWPWSATLIGRTIGYALQAGLVSYLALSAMRRLFGP